MTCKSKNFFVCEGLFSLLRLEIFANRFCFNNLNRDYYITIIIILLGFSCLILPLASLIVLLVLSVLALLILLVLDEEHYY